MLQCGWCGKDVAILYSWSRGLVELHTFYDAYGSAGVVVAASPAAMCRACHGKAETCWPAGRPAEEEETSNTSP